MPPPSSTSPRTAQKRLQYGGVALGAAYGVLFRAALRFHYHDAFFLVMSLTFLLGVPFVLGYLTVHVAERQGPIEWHRRIFLPWAATLCCLIAVMLLAWEGLICVLLVLPIALVASTAGGLLAVLVRHKTRHLPAAGTSILVGCVLLPFITAPLEKLLPPADRLRVVRTEIAIDADPATVWRNIEQVPTITPAEQHSSLFHAIGLPRPLAATLSHPGVGGVRHATFEGGVLFVETIDRWDAPRHLAFSIHADPATIPPTTLDEHVTVGGPFFDVLRGQYDIEALGPHRVVLHLCSTHRLSTHFNIYSGVWTDLLLRDVQNYILEILKKRCEARAPAPDSPFRRS